MNYDEMKQENQQPPNVPTETNNVSVIPPDKKKMIISAAVIFGVLLVGFLIGYIGYKSGRNAEIESRVVNFITKERIEKDEDINSKNDEILNLQKEISGLKTEKKELESIISLAKDYKANKDERDSEIIQKTNTIEQLDSQIGAKQSELDTLTGNVAKAKSAPKVLSAGEFVGGTDIPTGRYNVSGSSNFVVWSKAGSLKVNTILGNSIVGSGDYVCNINDGDRIKCSAKTTFTPIQ